MNNSKLFEFLLDNDCPFDFEIVGDWSEPITDESCTLKFTPKKEEENS